MVSLHGLEGLGFQFSASTRLEMPEGLGLVQEVLGRGGPKINLWEPPKTWWLVGNGGVDPFSVWPRGCSFHVHFHSSTFYLQPQINPKP